MYNTYVICIVFSAVEFEKKERTRGYLKKISVTKNMKGKISSYSAESFNKVIFNNFFGCI